MIADLAGASFGLRHGINFDIAANRGDRSHDSGADCRDDGTATRGREMTGHYLTTGVGNAVDFSAGPSGRIGTTEFSERYVTYGNIRATDSGCNPVQLEGNTQQAQQAKHPLWSPGACLPSSMLELWRGGVPDQPGTSRCRQSTFGNAKFTTPCDGKGSRGHTPNPIPRA
jgi:hypothetical protein